MLPALLVTLYGYHKTKDAGRYGQVNSKELGISLVANALLGGLMILILNMWVMGQVSDTYILNGKVTNKYQDTVSCEHSYEICTTSGKVTTCVTHYEHFEDYDWVVETSVGSLLIAREDRQGETTPQRFQSVILGEPASKEFHFNNYLLADKESLFLQNSETPSNIQQPRVYDYYRVNHVVGSVSLPKVEKQLDLLLQGKRFNVKVVTLNNRPVEDFYPVMSAWFGGKINDVIIVVSLDENGMVLWSKGNTYAKGYKNQMLLKDLEHLTEGQVFDEILVTKQISLITKQFLILDEQEFEEKLDLVEIPMWLLILVILINIGLSVGIHIKMTKEDL